MKLFSSLFLAALATLPIAGTFADTRPIGLPPLLNDAEFPTHSKAEVELGQLLFWDKILSGNRNISCASCHHPRFGTSDGLSLGMGEGGVGLGPDRKPDAADYPEQRIPRNAPALWNVGAKGFTVLFADGRIEADPSRATGFRTPLEDEMVKGFASLLCPDHVPRALKRRDGWALRRERGVDLGSSGTADRQGWRLGGNCGACRRDT